MTKLKQSLAPKSNNIKKMYRGEEGLLPRASPNLSVVALRAIAQGYRPKKLKGNPQEQALHHCNLQFNGFHLNAQCVCMRMAEGPLKSMKASSM